MNVRALENHGLSRQQCWEIVALGERLAFTRDRVGAPGCEVRAQAASQLEALSALVKLANAAVAA